MERKNILWLTSWYPNREDRFDGDFIQRHARAAAGENNITVIFVKPSLVYDEMVHENSDGVDETTVYIKIAKGWLKQVPNLYRWRRAFIRAVAEHIQLNGIPNLVHVHIPWKAGLIALYLKKKYGIPFIVTEHWGIYNDYVEDNFDRRWGIVKRLTTRICQESLALVSVSDYLGRAMRQRGLVENFTVIPNVVNNELFYLADRHNDHVFTFIHVSNMEDLKNVDGIITAFHLLLETGKRNARLVIAGRYTEAIQQKAASPGLPQNCISFTGEIPYPEVARELQRSDCFVLNSYIENAPCVISEALCCGLPVIATNVGGVPEMVNRSNGLLVPPGDVSLLAESMAQMIDNYVTYDRAGIAAAACQRYGFESVAAQFRTLYLNASRTQHNE